MDELYLTFHENFIVLLFEHLYKTFSEDEIFTERWNNVIFFGQVRQQLHDAGFMCEADVDDGNTLNKKVRNAQIAQFNFILGKRSTNKL